MATYGEGWLIPGLVAAGSLASNQYYIVIAASTAGAVKVGSTKATDKILGVLQNDPADGEAAEVMFSGISKVAAETSVAYGDAITVSTTGRAKTTTTDGDQILGIALEASSSAGDLIRCTVNIHDLYLA